MSKPKGMKTRYKTTNWTAYNAALKARGLLTIWLDKEMRWYAPASGKRGRQQTFTDAAIQFCLSIKCLFGLALRQSLGPVESLLRMAKLDWRVPDFSTISRRQKTLQVIRAIEVTDNSVGDAPMLPELLAQIPQEESLASVSADGAYDTRACHAAIALRGAAAIIPPRKNAQLRPSASAGAKVRNDAAQACKRLGWRI
jgi:hypothetical protein